MLIHAAGGAAVLAHPGLHDALEVVDELLSIGIDGLEAFHPCHIPAVVDLCVSMAKRHQLVITGGSDFHGMYGDHDCGLGYSVVWPDLLSGLVERVRRRDGLIIDGYADTRLGQPARN